MKSALFVYPQGSLALSSWQIFNLLEWQCSKPQSKAESAINLFIKASSGGRKICKPPLGLCSYSFHVSGPLTPAQERDIAECFKLLDEDGSGALDISELVKAFKLLGFKVIHKPVISLPSAQNDKEW